MSVPIPAILAMATSVNAVKVPFWIQIPKLANARKEEFLSRRNPSNAFHASRDARLVPVPWRHNA
jgi:hypothetical protein